MSDHSYRSLTKAITFRLLIIIVNSIIVFCVTHRCDATIMVMIATSISSTILYFLHERVWDRFTWGQKNNA